MSDPATFLERVQRRFRRHLHRHPRSLLRVARRPVLDTAKRRHRAGACTPFCTCADVNPACRQFQGPDSTNRCPRCGAPRESHDEQKVVAALRLTGHADDRTRGAT